MNIQTSNLTEINETIEALDLAIAHMSAPLDVMSPGCRPYNDLTKALQTLEMMRVAYLILRRNADKPRRAHSELCCCKACGGPFTMAVS